MLGIVAQYCLPWNSMQITLIQIQYTWNSIKCCYYLNSESTQCCGNLPNTSISLNSIQNITWIQIQHSVERTCPIPFLPWNSFKHLPNSDSTQYWGNLPNTFPWNFFQNLPEFRFNTVLRELAQHFSMEVYSKDYLNSDATQCWGNLPSTLSPSLRDT